MTGRGKTWLSLLCVAVTLLMAVAAVMAIPGPSSGQSGQIELTPEERRYLQSRGPIIFVSQTSYPPFEFRQKDGSMDGMCIELARWISTEAGFQARFLNMSFQEAQQAVLSGSADVITTLFYSEKRSRIFDFTGTMFQVPASIFVKAERPDISRLEDLQGKRIAIQRGDYAKDFLESKGIRFDWIPTDNFGQAADAVLADRADALVGDDQIVLYHLFSNRLARQAKKVGEPLYIGQNCMATRKGDALLHSIITKCVQHARASGAIDRISRKWLGVGYPEQKGRLARWLPYLGPAGGILLAVALLVLLWNLRLRQVVERRTRELAASETNYRHLVEHAGSIILKWTPTGEITFCNEFCLELFGYTRDELIGRNVVGTIVPETDGSGRDLAAMIREIAADPGRIRNNENENMKKNGERVWISWSNHAVAAHDGTITEVLSIGQDSTDRRRAEAEQQSLKEQLYQVQRIESIGRLAGGIAHDFNNLLTPIIGYADMLLCEAPEESLTHARARHIKNAAAKAKTLTRHLLSFGRKQTLTLKDIDLNEVVLSFADILKRTIRENIEIRLSLMNGAATIRADKTQIEQIIMNLVVNAQDAITGNGAITIGTERVVLTGNRPDIAAGRYVMLAVRDTGCGMDRETQDHIFEPFYTTKEVGKGAGLGLSTVYGIVTQHGGSIQVLSEPGRGSQFRLYFPFVPEAGEEEQREHEAEAATAAKPATGRVLLVEDDDNVRSMVFELLAGLGYDVIEAGSPAQALHLADGHQLTLLLTDVVMPEMDGMELYRRLRERQPGLKVLFMSGYTDVMELGSLGKGAGFMQKPFTLAEMEAAIAELLAASEPGRDEGDA